jgi:hypothetical protein
MPRQQAILKNMAAEEEDPEGTVSKIRQPFVVQGFKLRG